VTISGIPAGPQAAAPIQAATGVSNGAGAPREPSQGAMLSYAERAFFLSPSGNEAIGYGPGGGHTVAAPALGQHLDVRG
jgi:hypothetical protein